MAWKTIPPMPLRLNILGGKDKNASKAFNMDVEPPQRRMLARHAVCPARHAGTSWLLLAKTVLTLSWFGQVYHVNSR